VITVENLQHKPLHKYWRFQLVLKFIFKFIANLSAKLAKAEQLLKMEAFKNGVL